MNIPYYVRARGGLGNQLSYLAYAYVHANKYCRVIYFDLRSAGSPADILDKQSSLNDINFPNASNLIYIEKSSPLFLRFKAFVLRVLSLISTLYRSLPKRIKSSQLENFLIKNFLDYFAHKEGTEYAIAADSLGLFSNVSLTSPSKLFEDLRFECSRESQIGAHLRLGDFHEFAKGSLILPKSYYITALELLGYEKLDSEMFVFTDSPEMAAAFFEGIVNIRVISDLQISSVEEFFLLSSCNIIVGSHSTFSFWATFLSRSQRVVVPPRAHALPDWHINRDYIE